MLLGFVLALALGKGMRLLTLGDDVAHSLGVPVVRTRLLLLAASALLAAAVVSFAGLIGFVGLVVPHLAALLLGEMGAGPCPVRCWGRRCALCAI